MHTDKSMHTFYLCLSVSICGILVSHAQRPCGHRSPRTGQALREGQRQRRRWRHLQRAPGEIFGLLGPNGAGKTTTIGVLITSVLPTSGSAAIMGLDVARDPIGIKQRIAVVPQQSNLDRSLRVREILTFHAAYHGVPHREREQRADALLDELGLGDRKNERVARYSGGMSQRLMIARALMHAPDVLFLDEPTNNLDPQSRLFLWDRIRALNAQGLTILLTTHDMNEADQLCGRIAIMDKGRILVNDTSAELKKLIPGGNAVELRVSLPAPDAGARVLEALRGLAGVTKVDELDAGAPPAPDARDGRGELPAVRRKGARAGGSRHAGRAAGGRAGARSARQATQPGRRIHLFDREASALK